MKFKKMDKNSNAINWFEIPVADLDRARKFYEAIFDIEMMEMVVGEDTMYAFPYEPTGGKISGAIIKDANAISKMDGVTLYLNANPNIETIINRIEDAGGKVLMPKTEISPEIGFMSFFNDTEGNRLALHANA